MKLWIQSSLMKWNLPFTSTTSNNNNEAMRYNKGEFRDWLAQMRLMNNYLLHSWVQTWWKATSSKGLNWINLKIYFFLPLWERLHSLPENRVSLGYDIHPCNHPNQPETTHTHTHIQAEGGLCVRVCMCLCEWDMLSGGNLPYTLTT